MNNRKINEMIRYSIDVKNMNRNEHIKEINNVLSQEKRSKKDTLIGVACLGMGAGASVLTAILNGIGADPSLMVITGGSAIAGLGTGAAYTYSGISGIKDAGYRKDELALYVDKDLQKGLELTKKR